VNRNAMICFICFSLVQLSFSLFAQSKQNSNVIIISPQESQSFMFTNSVGLFYYGETGLPNTSIYHGLSFLTHKFMEDYFLEIGETVLNRSLAEVKLCNDSLIRSYPTPQLTEHVSIIDSLPAMIIRINTQHPNHLAFTPILSGSDKVNDYIINWSTTEKILYYARKNHLVRNDRRNYPVWTGVSSYPPGEYSETGIDYLLKMPLILDENIVLPGKINVYLEKQAFILIIVADGKNEVSQIRNQLFRQLDLEILKKNLQIEGIRKI